MAQDRSRDGDEGDGPSRRSAPRADVVMQLQYRNAGHLLVSYCTNLSRGGLFVPSSDPLAPGTRLAVSMAVPGDQNPVEVEAEVRWVRQFDAPEGPAGMGLAFDDIDDLMGETIDEIVSNFSPLQVALVGPDSPVRTHVAAQIRSLVSCETKMFLPDETDAETLAAFDLVVVDLDRAPERGLTLLTGLNRRDRPPPRVALCESGASVLRSRATGLARVITTPVDAEELRVGVLETVAEVSARIGGGSKSVPPGSDPS